MEFFLTRAKAFIPVIMYVISEVANKGFDLNTPTGLKALISAIVVAVGVYYTRNKDVKPADE